MTTPILTNIVTSLFGWNQTAGRYISLITGRFVSFSNIRNQLELVITSSAGKMDNISNQLMDGSITLKQWQLQMMENIKLSHIAASASANGGWAQLSLADWKASSKLVEKQFTFLQKFADQIADGTQKLDGRFLQRVKMYADASRGTFEEMRRRYELLNNGKTEERRLLGVADHCNSCLDAASLGWQPIGTLPSIGESVCLTNCHCNFEFK